MSTKTLEISEDLYNAIQKLKEVFQQMTGQKIEKDEDVVSILIGGFIDSLAQSGATEGTEQAAPAPAATENETPSGIIS